MLLGIFSLSKTRSLMKSSVRVLSLWSMMSLVACGGGGGGSGPAAKPGTVNKQGAASVVTMTGSMKSALSSGDGASLSGAVTSIGISGAQQIVQPAGAMAALTAVTSALSTPGPNGGTVDCGDTGCVYDHFKSGTTTMNGSIKSATAGDKTTVTTDLTIDIPATAGQQGDVAWKLTGDLDFTATSIDGHLQSTAKSTLAAGGQNIAYEYFNLVRYDALALGTDAKPTGGDIYAKWAITITGVPQGSQAYEGTVNFP
jgi:hypothetical protein